MPHSLYIRADIKGIEGIQRKLASGDPIYADAWREALKGLTDLAFNSEFQAMGAFSDGGTGLQANLEKTFDSRPIPEWGHIDEKAVAANYDEKRKELFRYPWALNASDRYHYGGTDSSTKGWWDKALKPVRDQTQDVLEKAAREVEARWASP